LLLRGPYGRQKDNQWFRRVGGPSLILFFYTLIFTGIAVWRYENFLYVESGDLTIFEQVIYNTLHGRPFYSTADGQNHFGVHNSPILAFLVPFAALIPAPYLLYFFTVLSIAVSAIPIYLIARDETGDELLALFLLSCYIMLPGLVGQIYQSFHEINLVLPFITFSFYYFVKERFYPFVAMFIFGLTVKEDVSLTLFMYSIYATIKKREMKWRIFPAIMCIAWLLLSVKVIIPFFNNSSSYPMISYLSDMGSSFSDIIANTLSSPQSTLQRLLQPDRLFYLYTLLLPLGIILPFFSAEAAFAVPSLFLNMLVETERFRYVEAKTSWGIAYIPRHMSLIVSVFLFISVIYSIKNISSAFGKYSKPAMFILVFLLFVMAGYGDRFMMSNKLYKRQSATASSNSIKRMLSLIPYGATVRADNDVATHLYNRKDINPSADTDTDYLVLQGLFYRNNRGLLNGDTGNPLDASITRKYDLVAFEKNYIALFKLKSRR